MKKAVFPGSFDPITIGHVDIIERALPLFDEIIIAIGVNASKKHMFTLEERLEQLIELFKDNPKVKIKAYSGLTIDFCQKENAKYIVRGLRNATDFNYEQSIAQNNAILAPVESIFIMCSPQVSHVSSSIVRDIIRNQGNASHLIPFKLY